MAIIFSISYNLVENDKFYMWSLFSFSCIQLINFLNEFIINKKIEKRYYKEKNCNKNIYCITIFELGELYNTVYSKEEKEDIKYKIFHILFKKYEKELINKKLKELKIYNKCLNELK